MGWTERGLVSPFYKGSCVTETIFGVYKIGICPHSTDRTAKNKPKVK